MSRTRTNPGGRRGATALPASVWARSLPARALAVAMAAVLVAVMALLDTVAANAAPGDGVNVAPRASVGSSVHDKGAIGKNFNANAILDGVKKNSGGGSGARGTRGRPAARNGSSSTGPTRSQGSRP